MPDSPKVFNCADTKPREFCSVRVWLPDGTQVGAIWTGKVWSGPMGATIEPVRWEDLPDYSMRSGFVARHTDW